MTPFLVLNVAGIYPVVPTSENNYYCNIEMWSMGKRRPAVIYLFIYLFAQKQSTYHKRTIRTGIAGYQGENIASKK